LITEVRVQGIRSCFQLKCQYQSVYCPGLGTDKRSGGKNAAEDEVWGRFYPGTATGFIYDDIASDTFAAD
jgi:hypothetical protein